MADDRTDPERFSIRAAIFGHRIVYKEFVGGRWRKLVVPAEHWGRGRYKLIRFSEPEWQRLTPQWAWNRKDLIEYRIITDPVCDYNW